MVSTSGQLSALQGLASETASDMERTALCRRERIYSSPISRWRKQRGSGRPPSRQRGTKPNPKAVIKKLPRFNFNDLPNNYSVGEVGARRDQATRLARVKPELCATAPNQVWAWDKSKLHGPQKCSHVYLYAIVDISSRSLLSGYNPCKSTVSGFR